MGRSGSKNRKLVLQENFTTDSEEKEAKASRSKSLFLRQVSDLQKESLALGFVPDDPWSVSFPRKDFSGHNLFGLNLSGSDFSSCDLKGVIFGDNARGLATKLNGVSFKNADLSSSNFAFNSIVSTSFAGSNLEDAFLVEIKESYNANFSGTRINHALIENSLFSQIEVSPETEIYSSEVRRSIFKAIDFQGVSFQETNFYEVTLKNSSFKEADFSRCGFVSSSFDFSADLSGALFRGAEIDKGAFISSNLDDSSFKEAKVKETLFEGASFERAFLGGEFSYCSFRESNFKDSVLSGAKFHNCDFRGSDIKKDADFSFPLVPEFVDCQF